MGSDDTSTQLHHAFIHLACDAEAFAGRFLEHSPVEDCQFTAVVSDQICLLEEPGGEIYALAADTQHVAQEFLREPELVLSFAMSGLEQPSAHPLLNGVMLDTSPVLRAALNEDEGITEQQL